MPALPELLSRLTGFPTEATGDTAWSRAADRLAIAHDLLATHFVGLGEPFSPHSHIVDQQTARAASVRLLEHLAHAVEGYPAILANAAQYPHTSPNSGTVELKSSLRGQGPRIVELVSRLVTEATPTERSADLQALDSLSPATPHAAVVPGAWVGFETSMDALATLRLVCFRQAAGLERTSTGSLHDLAQLGVHTTRQTAALLRDKATPLARVRRAVAQDALETAEAGWRNVADELGRNVRSLDRAPHVYADAVHTIVATVDRDPHLLNAVLTALPRLGHNAAQAVQTLAAERAIVTATRQRPRFEATWRPLSTTEAEQLAHRLTVASTYSQEATTALSQLAPDERGTPSPAASGATPPAPSRRQSLTREGVRR